MAMVNITSIRMRPLHDRGCGGKILKRNSRFELDWNIIMVIAFRFQ